MSFKVRKHNAYYHIKHILPDDLGEIEYKVNENGVRRMGAVEDYNGDILMAVDFDDFSDPLLLLGDEVEVIK